MRPECSPGKRNVIDGEELGGDGCGGVWPWDPTVGVQCEPLGRAARQQRDL